MESIDKDRDGARGSTRRCFWCDEPFKNRAEQELHVSLLGAPGEFHRACYEEYKDSQPAGQ